ncbi:glycosyltransferase [Roseateles sp. GG27B]
MKVLVAHNAYQHRGGEDSVAEAEVAMLRSRGHAVETYWRSNDDIAGISKARAVVQTIWSSQTTRELESLILAFNPDVIHVHNTMPLISPSLYWVAHKHQVPVVQTLHNFRLICPQALLLRDGRVCEDCVGKVPWRGVVHGCYRGSVAQTGVLAVMLSSHRLLGTWQNKVTRYIALNEFARDKYIEGGLPADRIMVKPNFVDVALHPPVVRSDFLFVGRLSANWATRASGG